MGGMKAVTLLLCITISLAIDDTSTTGQCANGADSDGKCSNEPLENDATNDEDDATDDEDEKPEGCAKRPTAAELVKDGELTVTFPWMKKYKGPRYTMPTVGKGKGKGGKRKRGWQKITEAYKEVWAQYGVREVDNVNATFIVTKSAGGAAPTDDYFMDRVGFCQEWPRHQVFNHVPHIGRISLKSHLPVTYKNLAQSDPDKAEDITKWIPPTYRLDDPVDCKAWQQKIVPGSIWIHKKDGVHNAKGLQALDYEGAKEVANNCLSIHSGRERGKKKTNRKLGGIQHYIRKPFLVNGKKCDFRVYFYVATTEPFVAFYSPTFYLKCGHNDYDENSLDPMNVFTNTKVGGVSREEHGVKNWDEVVISPEQFQDYLTEKGFAADWVAKEFTKQMKTKLGLVARVLDPALNPSLKGSGYEILGLDLMLDSEGMNFWLIEVNHSPGLDLQRGARAIAVEKILKAAVGVQVDLMKFAATGRPRSSLTLSDLPSRGELRLLSGFGA